MNTFKPIPPLWADFRLVQHDFASGRRMAIHRAYYLDEIKTNLYGIAPQGAIVVGSSEKGMLGRIDEMLDAFDRPALINPPTIKDNRGNK